MDSWEALAARDDFRALVDAAATEPQVVHRHDLPVAVVMSPDEYRRLRHLAGAGMARFLASTPFDEGDLPPIGAKLADLDEGADEMDAAIRRAQALVRQYAPDAQGVVDELLRERRAEAERE